MSPKTANPRIRLFALSLLAVACLGGCASDGGFNYDMVYEGLFGDEPPPSPTQAVAMMFDREDADARRKGITWLAASPFGGEEEYLKSYRLFITDPDANVRASTAKALGAHGTVGDAMLLVLLLSDEDSLVRWQAADALRKVHNPQAIPALVQRLDPDVEEDADTRTAAAQALGQYPDRVVFTRMVFGLTDRSYSVVNAARLSLIQLTGHDAGLDPRDWSDWSARSTDLFQGQTAYTYETYQPTRDWFDTYVTFWNNEAGEKKPKGLTKAEGDN